MLTKLESELRKIVSEGDGYTGLIVRGVKQGGINLTFNADRVFPCGSIIKVPIACVVLDRAAAGLLDLNQQVQVTQEISVNGSGVLQYLKPDLLIRLEDALVLSLIISDNIATNILIDAVGSFRIFNEYWLRWGMPATKISRYMMDFAARERGVDNFTSPQDMVLLFESVYTGQLLPAEQKRRLLEILAGQQVKHKLPDCWPEEVWFAHKTGELPEGIEHDVGILEIKEEAYIIVVMTSHFSSSYQALQQVRTIGDLIGKFLIY